MDFQCVYTWNIIAIFRDFLGRDSIWFYLVFTSNGKLFKKKNETSHVSLQMPRKVICILNKKDLINFYQRNFGLRTYWEWTCNSLPVQSPFFFFLNLYCTKIFYLSNLKHPCCNFRPVLLILYFIKFRSSDCWSAFYAIYKTFILEYWSRQSCCFTHQDENITTGFLYICSKKNIWSFNIDYIYNLTKLGPLRIFKKLVIYSVLRE